MDTYKLDSRETIELGGVKQSICLRAADEKLPLLLFLHGGPGVCDRHWVLKYQSSLAESAVMICWDQRGSGLSYDKAYKPEDFSVDLMVSDAAELAEKLCERFEREKLIIVGHSWGSLLGTLLAKRCPEHIAAYIGMGQFVRGDENEAMSYDFVMNVARETGNKKALAELERIGAPIKGHYKSLDDLMVQRNWMTKFGGGAYKHKESIWTSMVLPLLATPEYRLTDLYNYYKGSFFSLGALWDEVVDANLERDVKSLEMPVFLTEGRHDQNTPPSIAERWFEALEAPKKEWIWFESSAHSPIKEEPELWGETVKGIIASLGQF
ncbi:MAG: alpha/beta hydrolase [Oscillospiraceae bacterium]|nr:alpha/beta hydrolase [Oscillospiraceae bacterium]